MAKPKNTKSTAKEADQPVAAAQKAGSVDAKNSSDQAKKAVAKKKAAAKAAEKGPGFFSRARQFFREVRIELKKVTWPSRKETLASTSVVVILVVIIAVYLGLVDVILSRALAVLLP